MEKIEGKDFRRLLFLSLFILFLFFFIVFQFYKLQIVEGEKWARQARTQHHFSIAQPYKRGRFFANTALRQSHPEKETAFVFDVKRYHLYIDPIAIHEGVRNEIAEKIGECFSLQWDE